MKRIYIGIILAILVIAVMVVAGCKDDRTAISSILNQPNNFTGKEVVVAGNVGKSYEVNLIIANAGVYQLDDGSGKIWVITRNGIPGEGTQVGVKGIVSNGIKLGGESFGTVIREQDRRTR